MSRLTYIRGLVVFNDTAQGTFRRAEGTVEHVDKLGRLSGLSVTKLDVQASRFYDLLIS